VGTAPGLRQSALTLLGRATLQHLALVLGDPLVDLTRVGALLLLGRGSPAGTGGLARFVALGLSGLLAWAGRSVHHDNLRIVEDGKCRRRLRPTRAYPLIRGLTPPGLGPIRACSRAAVSPPRRGFGGRDDGHDAKVPAPDRGAVVMSNAEQAKGKVKQAVGDLTDDDELRREGKVDEHSGKAKEKLDELKDKADDAVDKIKDKLT
jgi:uncharacterized protein YjbJ (UPF0337 family)